jgi:hypothetical protein
LTVYLFNRSTDIRRHQNRVRNAARAAKHYARLRSSLLMESDAVEIERHFLRQFERSCEEKGARFVVAYIPGQSETGDGLGDGYTPEYLAIYRKVLLSLTDELRIETVDLLPHFLEAKRQGRYERFTFPVDEHWNDEGHTAAAEGISTFLLGERAHVAATHLGP